MQSNHAIGFLHAIKERRDNAEYLSSKSSRWKFCTGVFLAALTLAMCSMGAWCSWAPDCFSEYLPSARTLAETGELPQRRLIAPPGMTYLFAPLIAWMGDTPLLAIRLLESGCFVVVAVLTYLIHRRELSDPWAAAAALWVASSPILLRLVTTPLSEPAFMMFVCAWLLLMQRWERARGTAWWEAAWGGVLCSGIFFVRAIGIVAVPLSIWVLLKNRSMRLRFRLLAVAAFAVCTVGPLVAWDLRQNSMGGNDNYRRVWTQASKAEDTNATGLALQVQRLAHFGPLRLESLKEAFVPPDPFWRIFNAPLDRPFSWLIGGAVVVICCVRLLLYRRVADAYVAITLGMLALWPYDEGVRLIVPLFPILAAYPLWVLRSARQQVGLRGFARWAVACGLVIWSGIQIAGSARWLQKLPAYRDKQIALMKSMREIAAWQAGRLPAGGRYMGITPAKDNSKLLLAGASYLAHRAVQPLDQVAGRDFDFTLTGMDAAIVFRSLKDAAEEHWKLAPCDAPGPFVVFVPPQGKPADYAEWNSDEP